MAGWASRSEIALERWLARQLWRRGWRPVVIPYTGYGAAAAVGDGWVRVLARVLLTPVAGRERQRHGRRGWRRFLTISLPDVAVVVDVGQRRHAVRSTGAGYVDAVLPSDLAAGWQDLRLHTAFDRPVSAPIRVVGAHERRGVVSDIDDTVLVTAIPRPVLAFWNSFVRSESARRPVPGMAGFLARLTGDGREAFTAYVSTGAWNVAPPLARFLAGHGYPPGPLLLTDWGPTETGLFRSGRAHKRATLRRLAAELPWLQWSLVGDDGQHDPQLYADLARDLPGRVTLVAVRQLSQAEQLRTHGTTDPPADPDPDAGARPQPDAGGVLWLRGADGTALTRLLDIAAGEGGAATAGNPPPR